MSDVLTIAVLGCGSRGRTYSNIIGAYGDRYRLTAAADLVATRRETVASCARDGGVRQFENADDFFSAGKLADVVIIATQDSQHYGHAMAALELGYDVVLEKPAAESLARCVALDQRARELGRRIVPCFVLRYTPFYSTVKQLIDSGRLGRVISIRSHEGVEPYHQAHSFVRGHWANTATSSPMIVAKCSHDADLLCWFSGAPLRAVSSHGERSWFRKENAPPGAPARCTDGCPAAGNCLYDAHHYLGGKRRWLRMVMDGWETAKDAEIIDFLKNSAWGRCVYHCDNDTVDHQVVACELTNGVTASHTMTAFDCGRSIEIYGTLAALKGGDTMKEAGAPELWLRHHASGMIESVPITQPVGEGYAGHGGGDQGLVEALSGLFQGEGSLPPGLDGLAGHQLAYLAEEARISGKLVTV